MRARTCSNLDLDEVSARESVLVNWRTVDRLNRLMQSKGSCPDTLELLLLAGIFDNNIAPDLYRNYQ